MHGMQPEYNRSNIHDRINAHFKCSRNCRIWFFLPGCTTFFVKTLDLVQGPPLFGLVGSDGVSSHDAFPALCFAVLDGFLLVLESWGRGWVEGREWVDDGELWEDEMGTLEWLDVVRRRYRGLGG